MVKWLILSIFEKRKKSGKNNLHICAIITYYNRQCFFSTFLFILTLWPPLLPLPDKWYIHVYIHFLTSVIKWGRAPPSFPQKYTMSYLSYIFRNFTIWQKIKPSNISYYNRLFVKYILQLSMFVNIALNALWTDINNS